MGILKKIFATSSKGKINKPTIIYKSEMPEYIDAANKIYNKEYDSAITELKKQLKNASQTDFQNLSMIHINLMQAYFKSRNANPDYLELSTLHAKEALKYGHNTGLAPFRLIVNLEKQNRLRQAIEVCEILTAKDYNFSIHGYKQKKEFVEKLNELVMRLEKYGDNKNERLFSDEEKNMIIESSKKNK